MATMKTVWRIKVLRVFAYLLSPGGHVEDLKYHDLIDDETDKPNGYCYFQFKFKPTESSKTEDGKDFYWGFLVL